MLKRSLGCFLAILIFTMGSSGCNRTTPGGIDGTNSGFNINRASEISPRPVYDIPIREKAETLFRGFTQISNPVIFNNGVYVSAIHENEPYKSRQIFYCDFDNGNIALPFFQIEDFVIRTFTALNDGSLIILGYPAEIDDEGYATGTGNEYYIYKQTAGGLQLLVRFPSSKAPGSVNSLAVDEDREVIYVETTNIADSIPGKSTPSVVTGYSMDGELLREYKIGEYINGIHYSYLTGNLYIFHDYDDNKPGLRISTLDTTQGVLHDTGWIPDMGPAAISTNENGFYASAINTDMIMYYDYITNTYSEIFSKIKYGLSGLISFIYEYDDRYIVMENTPDKGIQFIKLAALDEYTGPVETIRIGLFNRGGIGGVLADFSFYNPQYKIELIDYSIYGNEAASNLHMDVIKGIAPDVLLLSDTFLNETYLPIRGYIASGALLDLAPYMARDLITDDYWMNIIDLLYLDSPSCYISVPSFMISAITGAQDAVDNLNIADSKSLFNYIKNDLISDIPKFSINMNQAEFIVDMVLMNMKQFVNYHTGKVQFDKDSFITLLEAAKILDSEQEYSSIDDIVSLARGDRKLSFLKMYHCGDLQMYAAALNGNFKVTGYPGNTNGVTVIPQYIFGISAATENPEGAWALLRFIYENEEMHTTLGASFPINKESFHKQTQLYKAAQATEADYENVYYYVQGSDGITVRIPALSAEGISDIVKYTGEMLENANDICIADINILNIIYEEIPSFLYSSKTAKDTARAIQSRVQIYINEITG